MSKHRSWFVLAAALAASLIAVAWAQDAGETVIKRGQIEEDSYLAGGRVDVDATLGGDLIAAGGELLIQGEITQDLVAAGGELSLRAAVGDDLRAAGGRITIEGDIAGDLVVAGGEITLLPGSTVGGRVWAAGGRLSLAGALGRELRAAGGSVRIAGHVRGDAELVGESIELVPGTRIDGSLRYRSPEPLSIPKDVVIAGDVVHQPLPDREGGLGAAIGGLLWYLAAMGLTGLALHRAAPGFVAGSVDRLTRSPLRSLGTGTLAVFSAPVIVMVLAVVVVGLPLALVVLLLLPVTLLSGFLLFHFTVARLGVSRLTVDLRSSPARRAGAFLLALLAVAVLMQIPLLGFLLLIVAVLAGTGAGLMEILHRRRRGG